MNYYPVDVIIKVIFVLLNLRKEYKMAYIQKKTNAKGETIYKIKVSCGYDINGKQVTHTLTYGNL